MLKIRNLKTYFYTEEGIIKAVDDVSFSIDQGKTIGLVGESGCGKSVTALSIMRLIDDPPGKIIGGEILLKGQNLLEFPGKKMRTIRGNEISMIFQEPMTSLNPVFTIGNQMMETLRLHQGLTKKEAQEKAIEMLTAVRISDAEKRFKSYPHQLSGGMLQRVMIAMALSCNPALIIADEPTTALDVTIQAQIMKLLADLKEKYQLSLLLITHDLGIVAEVADRVAVMYAGKIVEEGDAELIFANPCHPYTMGLMASIPRINGHFSLKDHLATIEGIVPNPLDLPPGCTFEPRCAWKMPRCSEQSPPLYSNEHKQHVACFLYQEGVLKSMIQTGQTTE